MVQDYLREGVFSLAKNKYSSVEAEELLDLANSCFSTRGHPVKIVDKAEIETLMIVLENRALAMVIDERTLRLLVENPKKLEKVLESRLRTNIKMNKKNVDKFKELTQDIKIMRSTELAYIAYKLNLLNRYITAKKVLDPTLKKELLEGALWALKLKGCSISGEEINEMLGMR